MYNFRKNKVGKQNIKDATNFGLEKVKLNLSNDSKSLESKNKDESIKVSHSSLYDPGVGPLRDKRIPFACVVNQLMLQNNRKQSHR